MFRCENCGTGFNATVASVSETCPRCKAGGVDARLTFRLFEPDRGARPVDAQPEVREAAAPGRAQSTAREDQLTSGGSTNGL